MWKVLYVLYIQLLPNWYVLILCLQTLVPDIKPFYKFLTLPSTKQDLEQIVFIWLFFRDSIETSKLNPCDKEVHFSNF